MEKNNLHSELQKTMSKCWNAYTDSLLTLPAIQLIGKAAEISAARFCFDELTENTAAYPDYLLEHLLHFDDPLEVMREQWMNEQYADQSSELEHAMWSLWDHGPRPDETPAMGVMTMQ